MFKNLNNIGIKFVVIGIIAGSGNVFGGIC
jgi:hypothetical protein